MIPFFFPLMMPSSSMRAPDVHNHIHFDTKGIERGLSDLTGATRENGKHLDRIATEMEAEKYLVTVTASEIHERAVLVGQTLFDARERYYVAREGIMQRLTKIRAWQSERRQLADERRRDKVFTQHIADLRAEQDARDQDVAAAQHKLNEAVITATTEWLGQTGWRIFHKSVEHFQAKHGVAEARAEYNQAASIPHVICKNIHDIAAERGESVWDAAREVMNRDAVLHPNGSYHKGFCPVSTATEGDDMGWLNHERRMHQNGRLARMMGLTGRYSKDATDNIVDRHIGKIPPELAYTDEICELAEVTRYAQRAQVQVKQSTLVMIGRIASQLEQHQLNGIQKEAQVY